VTLQRLVLTFKPEGIEARALYRTKAGPGPGTKARRQEVTELTRTGLERALTALDAGDVEDLGTSGFTTREDTFLCNHAPTGLHKKPTEGART
jgi:hypothetical protein